MAIKRLSVIAALVALLGLSASASAQRNCTTTCHGRTDGGTQCETNCH